MNIQALYAFGWKLSKVQAQDGERFSVVVPSDTLAEKLSPYTLFTEGRITGVRDKTSSAVVRAAGFANDYLPETVTAGRYDYLVETAATWWCFEARHNGNEVPGLSVLRVAQGESVALPQNALLLLCAGSVEVGGRVFQPGTAITVTSVNASLLAQTGPTYALCFERARNA